MSSREASGAKEDKTDAQEINGLVMVSLLRPYSSSSAFYVGDDGEYWEFGAKNVDCIARAWPTSIAGGLLGPAL
jgi:hypothetical protein